MFDIKKLFSSEKEPQFNEPLAETQSGVRNQPESYHAIQALVKKSPEVLGILNAVTTDIISDGFYFTGGKQAVAKTIKFVKNQFFKEELKKAIFDWLEYGDGYLWNAFVTTDIALNGDTPDEDLDIPVKHIPSFTVNIYLNEKKTKINRFEQWTDFTTSARITWTPKEVIHGKFNTLDGKVYGFSPLMTVLPVVNTLGYLKDYANAFFKNGGTPDFMFILKNGTEQQIRNMAQKLQRYKNPQNKHGNLTLAGDWNIERLNDFKKDMEFQRLATYFTGVIALAYNMPMSRLAPVLGADVSVGAGVDDASVDAYWSKIAEHQDYWENLLNSQLWTPFFNTEMKFNKSYKQNEFRESQRDLMIVDTIGSMAQFGIKPTKEYVMRKLFMKDEDLDSFNLSAKPSGMERQAQMNKQDVEKGPATQGMAKQKQKESTSQPKKVV